MTFHLSLCFRKNEPMNNETKNECHVDPKVGEPSKYRFYSFSPVLTVKYFVVEVTSESAFAKMFENITPEIENSGIQQAVSYLKSVADEGNARDARPTSPSPATISSFPCSFHKQLIK